MLNNVIIKSIIYRSSCWGCAGKKVFFDLVALHSCQVRIRLQHLVTICDFNNLYSKSVAFQLAAIWKKKISRWCFWRISAKKIRTPTFQNTFCWLLLLCLLHTALISNAFSVKIKIKENGTLWLWRNEMEDSVFIKTEDAFGKFCFWL